MAALASAAAELMALQETGTRPTDPTSATQRKSERDFRLGPRSTDKQVGAIGDMKTELVRWARAPLGMASAAGMFAPIAARVLAYGDGKHRPADAVETGESMQLIPGRWAHYGEMTTGYQEERDGGSYLKKLQNTKPLPMWWRYNGKTPPPWFQPNEPLQRAHLLRAPVPVPAPPFRTPFTPAWATAAHPKPPQPAEFPYKHPMSMPWGGDGMMQCPCPGNPNLQCDCLSIQYPVELPTPEKNSFNERVDMDKKMARRRRMLVDELLQPNLLEGIVGSVLGMLWGWGDMRQFPANVAKANPMGFGVPLAMALGTAIWFVLRLFMVPNA